MGKTTFKWLDRRVAAAGPYLCLCLSEEEYEQALRHLQQAPSAPWIATPQSNATAHIFQNNVRGFAVVVCLSCFESRAPVEVAGLLVHGAVHVWQEYCAYYGETNPGHEQEAYAIQAISQELMAEFARRMGCAQ